LPPLRRHEWHKSQAQIPDAREAVGRHAAHGAHDYGFQIARDLGACARRWLEDSLHDVSHDGVDGRAGEGKGRTTVRHSYRITPRAY